MSDVVSITGEISLLWRDVDPYHGDVILVTLDTDEALAMNTFELKGELARRFPEGAMQEGDRVCVDCVADVIEVVNPETGETFDEAVVVVADVRVLAP